MNNPPSPIPQQKDNVVLAKLFGRPASTQKGFTVKGSCSFPAVKESILVLDPEEILFLEFLFLHYQFHCLETHKLRWIKCFSLQNTDCFSFTKIPGIKP